MRRGAGNRLRCLLRGALEAELEMIQTRVDKSGERFFAQGQAAGDQADVQTGGAPRGDQLDNVGTRERLATRQVRLEHACGRGFLKNTSPSLGGQFGVARGQLQRIRAIHAAQRAAVG